MIKVYLTIFTYGGLARHTVESFTAEVCKAQDVQFQISWLPEDALIERSRSIGAALAMRSDCDVWMQIDHDIGWNPGDVAGLAKKCVETKGIVAGLYTLKQPKMMFPWRAVGDPGMMTIGDDRLIEAETVSTGFMASYIPAMRDACGVLAKAEDHELKIHQCDFRSTQGAEVRLGWWDLFRCTVQPPREGSEFCDFMSEDWAYCWRMRKAGVKCWAWTKPILTHYGAYGWNVATTHQEAPEAPKG